VRALAGCVAAGRRWPTRRWPTRRSPPPLTTSPPRLPSPPPPARAGVTATLVGAIPFEGIKFGANEFFKQRLPRGADGRTPPVYSLVAGAVAGTLAHVLTHPLDTVRRRMQISGAAGSSLVYKNMVDCVRRTIATEGVGALFLGIVPTVVRAVPNLGIQFWLYELLKLQLKL